MNNRELFEIVYKELQERIKYKRQKLFFDNIKKDHYIIAKGDTDKYTWEIIGERADCNHYKSIFIDWIKTISNKSILNFAPNIHYKNIGKIKWEDIIKVNTDNLTDLNYKDGLLKNHISKLKAYRTSILRRRYE